MELKDLVGIHELTGVDYSSISDSSIYMEQGNVMDMIIDGKVISAVEDPEDGYRSCLGQLLVDRVPTSSISNTFPPVTVIAEMTTNEHQDLLYMKDRYTGKLVIVVGTDNTDDYYPVFVDSFMPENMTPRRELRGRGIMRH